MPSWRKEKDGLEWYDEAYTAKQTNQSPAQLEKKAKAKKIRRFKQRGGGYWYAGPDVETLREAYLKRSNAAKGWKPNDAQLEAKHTRQWKRDLERERKRRRDAPNSLGSGGGSPVAAHQEKVMLQEVSEANAKRKAEDE